MATMANGRVSPAKFMGRNCHGPKLTWADFVMGRNDPEPLKTLQFIYFLPFSPLFCWNWNNFLFIYLQVFKMIPNMIGFVNWLLRWVTMLRTFQMPSYYCFSSCVHLSVTKSCWLYNLKTVRDISTKHQIFVKHIQTTCLFCHAQEP